MPSNSAGFASPVPRKVIFAWAMYDWANSAFSTLLITVVMYYLQTEVLPGPGGPVAYALGIGVGMLLAAVLSPLVGAAADARRSKHRWLAGTALGGAAAAVLLALWPSAQTAGILTVFVVMNLLFEISLVPYNGFLPEITREATVNRISAFGFALGYVGGAIPLALAWAMLYFGKARGYSPETLYRCGIGLLGLWWGVFSLPAILLLQDRGEPPSKREPLLDIAQNAFREVFRTLSRIRRYPCLFLFLLAYLFYNDGVQTVVTQAGTFAIQDLKFEADDFFALVLLIQAVALPGSLLVGWLSDRWGQKRILVGCLLVWIGLLVSVLFVRTQGQLWALGVILAGVMGGTQSVSRAMMSLLTPPQHTAEFFGFYNLSGKAASPLGPLLFALVFHLTGGVRWAAGSLLIFFIIGLLLVARLNLRAGRREATQAE